MRYIIKERIFSLTNSFTIKDEAERPRYQVVGKFFSLGKKLNLYDMNNNDLVYIEQKIFRFLPEYNIYENNSITANVKKELTFFKPRFNIKSIYGDISIDGDVFRHEFNIYNKGNLIAGVSKRWISFSDTYSLEIYDDTNHPFILSLVIVLDQIYHDGENNG